jgi:hypothetical protein
MRDICPRTPAVYIQCVSGPKLACASTLRNAQCCTNYLQKLGNEFRLFVTQAGYHAASPFCQTHKHAR